MLDITLAITPSAKHDELCKTFVNVLREQGVDPVMLSAFTRLIRRSITYRSLLRRERANNVALCMLLNEPVMSRSIRLFSNKPIIITEVTKIHGMRWWCARFLMRLRGDLGCGGKGYTLNIDGTPVVCRKFGCH